MIHVIRNHIALFGLICVKNFICVFLGVALFFEQLPDTVNNILHGIVAHFLKIEKLLTLGVGIPEKARTAAFGQSVVLGLYIGYQDFTAVGVILLRDRDLGCCQRAAVFDCARLKRVADNRLCDLLYCGLFTQDILGAVIEDICVPAGDVDAQKLVFLVPVFVNDLQNARQRGRAVRQSVKNHRRARGRQGHHSNAQLPAGYPDVLRR